MDISGEHRIEADRERVWGAIFDVDMLKACIPGCRELEQVAPTAFKGKVQIKIGPVSATLSGTVELQDVEAPSSCRIVGRGDGGIAGFVRGSCDVKLATDGTATELNYVAKVDIGGKLAALGGRLVQSTARKLAEQFFSTFVEQLKA